MEQVDIIITKVLVDIQLVDPVASFLQDQPTN